MPAFSRYLAWGEETTYGTAAASVTNYVDIESESLRRVQTYTQIRPHRWAKQQRQNRTRRHVAGSIDALVGWDSVGAFLRYLIDRPDSSGPASGIYTHLYYTHPNSESPTPSLTMDVPREVTMHRHLGCVLTGGSIVLDSTRKILGLRLDVLGADETTLSIPSVASSAFDADPPIDVGDVTATSSLSLTLDDGSTSWAASMESATLTYTNSRKLRNPPRSDVPTGFVPGMVVGVKLAVKWVYDDDSEFLVDAIRDRTTVDVTLLFVDGLKSLRFKLPACYVDGQIPTVSGAGYRNIPLAINFTPIFDTSIDYFMEVQLKNETASY